MSFTSVSGVRHERGQVRLHGNGSQTNWPTVFLIKTSCSHAEKRCPALNCPPGDGIGIRSFHKGYLHCVAVP